MLALALPVLLSLASPQGDPYRLNPRFPLVPGGDVLHLTTSPDGQWIVYVADVGSVNVPDVFRVPADGSAPPLQLTTGGDVLQGIHGVTVSPDGAWVVYTRGLDVLHTVYSVPMDGSAAPVDLTGPRITDYAITPDSSHVLFRDDSLSPGRFLLKSAPIGGGPPVVLNGPLTGGADVEEFILAPDGVRVVYRADALVDGRFELFSVRLDTPTAAVLLSPTPVPAGNVTPSFLVDATSTRVVYLADTSLNEVFELFTVPIDGSAGALRLNAPLSGAQDAQPDFVPSPDGARVVYRSDERLPGVFEVFSAPIDASVASTRLCSDPVTGGDVSEVAVSADGTRVVFRGDLKVDGQDELFAVPIDGSAAQITLNDPLAVGEDVLAEFALAATGGRVAFQVGSPDGTTLSSVPITGGGPTMLDLANGTFTRLEAGANGLHLYYARPDTIGVDLWSVRLDGSTAATALSAGEDLRDFRLIAGGGGAVFVADQDLPTVFELFGRPASGAFPAFQISAEFVNDTISASIPLYTVAGSRAVYVANPDLGDPDGLWSVPIAAGRAPVQLSAIGGEPITVFRSLDSAYVPANKRVLFRGTRAGGRELFSVPVDGSTEPISLSGPLAASRTVSSLVVSADGSHVVYRANQDFPTLHHLYRVLTDGSGPPTRIEGSESSSGGGLHVVNADASLVVFAGNLVTGPGLELYASDGVNPPVTLHVPAILNGSIGAPLLLTPDGFVVYNADSSVDGFFELFRVPVDGSAPPLKLSGASLTNTGVLSDMALTPDGTRVVFRAWAQGRRELFSVPTDGSTPPVQLNTLSASGILAGVSEFQIDPSGALVVFRNNPDNHRLYSVPVTGGPNVELTPLIGIQYVLEDRWAISPDGTRVVYELFFLNCCTDLYSTPIGGGPRVQLDAGIDDAYLSGLRIDPTGTRVAFQGSPSAALWLAPIDGSGPPARLSPPEGSPGSDFAFTASGDTLLFRSDVRQPGADDLYGYRISPGPRPAGSPSTVVER